MKILVISKKYKTFNFLINDNRCHYCVVRKYKFGPLVEKDQKAKYQALENDYIKNIKHPLPTFYEKHYNTSFSGEEMRCSKKYFGEEFLPNLSKITHMVSNNLPIDFIIELWPYSVFGRFSEASENCGKKNSITNHYLNQNHAVFFYDNLLFRCFDKSDEGETPHKWKEKVIENFSKDLYDFRSILQEKDLFGHPGTRLVLLIYHEKNYSLGQSFDHRQWYKKWNNFLKIHIEDVIKPIRKIETYMIILEDLNYASRQHNSSKEDTYVPGSTIRRSNITNTIMIYRDLLNAEFLFSNNILPYRSHYWNKANIDVLIDDVKLYASRNNLDPDRYIDRLRQMTKNETNTT